MGVAVLSGVIASLESAIQAQSPFASPLKWESHTSGTSTPTGNPTSEPSTPSSFIACVSRQESARKLRSTFKGCGAMLGVEVEVVVGRNVESVDRADVVLLWWVFEPTTSIPYI